MSESGLSRRLAVILVADVAGFSRHMEEDEERTVKSLNSDKQTLEQCISEYHGRIFGSSGDSVIAEFSSPSDAVRCAVKIQNGHDVPENQPVDMDRLRFRIGINLGDVIVQDGDLLGDGVNIAARLEAIADPGGIVVSRSIHDQVRKKHDLEFQSLGEKKLKNIREAVEVYRVVLSGAHKNTDDGSVRDIEDHHSGKPSIAVLPFTNMSGDVEQDYFSDGITEDLTTALSRISSLDVVARNTMMLYKNNPVDVKQAGTELGVRYVLEGSVRRSGNRVRVNAQLIDTHSGHHQWADRYDRELNDIFTVQDDITHNITVEMRVQLSLGEKARMLAGRTKSAIAWEKQLLADELNNNFIRGDNRKARKLCKEVLEIDPDYVSAWTELGWTYLEDVLCGWTDSPETSLEKTVSAIDRAMDLEPDYPLALSLLGYVYALRDDYDQALEVSEKSVMLVHDNAETVAELAHMLLFAGQIDDALSEIRKALRLCPVRLMWHLTILGQCLHASGATESAIDAYNEAIGKGPYSPFPRICLVGALMDAGDSAKANQAAQGVLELEHDFSLSRWRGAHFKDPEIRSEVLKQLENAGLPS